MNDQKFRSRLITLAFCLCLFFVSLVSALHPKRTFSETENRYLQGMPAFSWDSLRNGKFGRQYETYLSDQFPFRDRWVGLKTRAEQAQLSREINRVYLGEDGYLIEAFYEEDLDAELRRKNIEYLRTFAKDQAMALGEARVRVMLVPSASQVLTDKLPPFSAPLVQEEIYAKLEDLGPLLVPVGERLRQEYAKNPEIPLYYRTDHHWTARGSLVGYEAWRASRKQEAESAAPESPLLSDGSSFWTVSGNFYGTIVSKLNVPTPPDSIELFLPADAPEYDVFYDGSADPVHSLYSMDALGTRDQYRVYLDGNHGWTKIVNRTLAGAGSAAGNFLAENPGAGRLLILKDSYAHSFAPYASLDFGEVHMLDLRYYNGRISDFIREQGITDVLILYNIPGFLKDGNLSKLIR